MDLGAMRVTELQLVFHISQLVGSLHRFDDRKGYGLVFVESGTLRFEESGLNGAGPKRHYADNQHILYIPKGASYLLTCAERSEYYVLNFDALDAPKPHAFHGYATAPSRQIISMLGKMYTNWEFHRESTHLSNLGMLYEILSRLNQFERQAYQPKSRFAQIAPSIEYLEAHYADPGITNELLSEASGVSTVYFRKLFTERYGLSPMRYVRKKRIEKAQTLLEIGYSNITEIAESVGYNSIYHFSKTFKLLTGVSPSEYLRSQSVPARHG